MSKYKYYFRKPRSEIVKDVFKWLALSGIIYIAASSPYFTLNLMKEFKKMRKYKKRKIYDNFYNLQKQGYINIEKRNHQIYISLTKKGKEKAGWLQIDELKIKKPKKWDEKWRIVIFDIAQLKNIKRNIFRGKLKELNFHPLQKSVWVHPYKCKDEIGLLRDFLGLTKKEICLITANEIENNDYLIKLFKL